MNARTFHCIFSYSTAISNKKSIIRSYFLEGIIMRLAISKRLYTLALDTSFKKASRLQDPKNRITPSNSSIFRMHFVFHI